jgi:hypothetical protein
MGRLQRVAQQNSNPTAWAHSTDADPSGPRWHSGSGQRAGRAHNTVVDPSGPAASARSATAT